MWERMKQNFRRQENGKSEAEYRQELFAQIRASHAEWLRAHRLFHEATGKDEIDYAIFVLEAAERKYQIHLKSAKQQVYIVSICLRMNLDMSMIRIVFTNGELNERGSLACFDCLCRDVTISNHKKTFGYRLACSIRGTYGPGSHRIVCYQLFRVDYAGVHSD